MTVGIDEIRRGLWPVTLIYLAIPVVVFFVGALHAVAAAVLVTALGAALWSATRDGSLKAGSSPRRVPAAALVVAALPFVAAFVAGALSVAFDHHGDWVQRFEVFHDWVRQPWPVVYETDAGPVAQVYYIGWYLPAALVESALGWTAGMVFLALWTAIGTGLAAAWLIVVTRAHPVLAATVFIGFTGIEIWRNLLEDGLWNTLVEALEGDTFHWGKSYFWYRGATEGLSMAPMHAVVGWVLAGMTLDAAGRRDASFPIALLLGIGLLWSPFAVLGAAPLCAAQWLCAEGSLRERMRRQLDAPHLAGVLVGLAIAAYYAARWFPFDLPEVYLARAQGAYNGLWLLAPDVDSSAFLHAWAISCTIHVLVLAVPVLAVARYRPRMEPRTLLALVAALFLLVLPQVRYGFHNDLPRNAAFAAQFVLLAGAAELLARARGHRLAASALVLFLALGGITTLARQVRHGKALLRNHEKGVRLGPPVRDVFDRQLLVLERDPAFVFDRLNQYVGSVDSPFFRYLAKEARPRVIETPPPREDADD